MKKAEKQRFYINNRSYSPDDSMILCSYCGIFEHVSLYYSPHGEFFSIEECEAIGGSPVVRILSAAEAQSLMDCYPAGIYVKNYHRLFGKPEQG